MGPDDYIETVLTCKGDYYDPEFPRHLERFSESLRQLIKTEKQRIIIKKVEPWNSVRVTFNIPKEAAQRLRLLAEQGNQALQEIGVLAVQIEGDRVISLTIAGKNNERTELVLRTSDGPQAAPGMLLDGAAASPTKTIGALFGPSGGLMDTLGLTMPDTSPGNNIFRPPGSVAASPLPGQMQQPLMMPDRNGPSMPGPSFNQVRPGMIHAPGPDLTSPGYSQSPPGSSPQFTSPHVGQSPSPGPFQSQTPPPPYPGLGINNLNKSVFNKALNQAAPGLLVNLLQHEGAAAQNNGQPQKMPPPEVATPQKRRRRRQKEKPANGSADKQQSKAPPRQSKILPADKEAFIMHLDDIMQDVVGDDDNDRESPKPTSESPFISSVSHSYSNSPVDSPASSINTRASTDSNIMENASLAPGKDETRLASPMDTSIKLENHIKEETGSTSQDTPPYDQAMKTTNQDQINVTRIKRDSEHDEHYHPAPANCIINPYTGQLEPRITEAMSDSDHCDSERRRHDSGPARASPRKSLSPIRSTDGAPTGADRNVLHGLSVSNAAPDTDSRLTEAHGDERRRSPGSAADPEAAGLTQTTVPSPSSQNPAATNSPQQHLPRSPGHHGGPGQLPGQPLARPQSPRLSNPGFVNTSTLWRATSAAQVAQVAMMGLQTRHGLPAHSMPQRGPYPQHGVPHPQMQVPHRLEHHSQVGPPQLPVGGPLPQMGMPHSHPGHIAPHQQVGFPRMRMGVPYPQPGVPISHPGEPYPSGVPHSQPGPHPVGVPHSQANVPLSKPGTPPSQTGGPSPIQAGVPYSKPGTPPSSQAAKPHSPAAGGHPSQVGPSYSKSGTPPSSVHNAQVGVSLPDAGIPHSHSSGPTLPHSQPVAPPRAPFSQASATPSGPPYPVSGMVRQTGPNSLGLRTEPGPPGMVRMVHSQYAMTRMAQSYPGMPRMAQPPPGMVRMARPPGMHRPPHMGQPRNPHQPELRRMVAPNGNNGPVAHAPGTMIPEVDSQPESSETELAQTKSVPSPTSTPMASRSPRATPVDSKPSDVNGPVKFEPLANHVGENSSDISEALTPKETAKQQLLDKVPSLGLQNFIDHSVTVNYALSDTSNGEMDPKEVSRMGSVSIPSLDNIRMKLDNSVPNLEDDEGSRTLSTADTNADSCKPAIEGTVTQGTESGSIEAPSTSPRATPAPATSPRATPAPTTPPVSDPSHVLPVNGPVRSPGSARQSTSPRSPRADLQHHSPDRCQPVHTSETPDKNDPKAKPVKRGAKLSDICAKLAVQQNDVKLSKSGPSPKEQDKRARSPATPKPKEESPSSKGNSPRAPKPAPDLAFFNSPLHRLTAPIFPFNLTQSVKKVVGPIPSSDPVKLKPTSPRSASPRGSKDCSPPVLYPAVHSGIRLTLPPSTVRLTSTLEATSTAANVTVKTTEPTTHPAVNAATAVIKPDVTLEKESLGTSFSQLNRLQDSPDGRKATYERKSKTTNVQVNPQTVKSCSPGNSVVSVVVQNASRQNDDLPCPAGLLDHAYVQRTVLTEPLDLAKSRPPVTVARRVLYDNGDVNCEHIETPLNLTSAKATAADLHKMQVNGPKEPNGPSESSETLHKSPVGDSRLDTDLSKGEELDKSEKRNLRAPKRKPDDETLLDLPPVANKRKRRLTDDSASSGKTNSIDYLSEDEARDDLLSDRRRTQERRSRRHSSRSNSRGSEITEEHEDHAKVQTRSSSRVESRRSSDDSLDGVKKVQDGKRLETDPGRPSRPQRNSPVREMPDKRATRSSKPKDGPTPAPSEAFPQPPLLTTNTSKRRRFSRDQQR